MEPFVEGPELVKMVSSVVKAANDGDGPRTTDGLQQLGRQRVSAGLLSATGAGKKVFLAMLSPPPPPPNHQTVAAA